MMSSALARPLLHTVHVLTFTALLGSGLLIFVPGLRAAVTGGYSQIIRETHRWGGVAFAVLPGLIMLTFGVRTVFTPASERGLRVLLQRLHTLVTFVIGGVFVVTGFLMWAKDSVSESVFDASQSTHDWLTYAVAALVVFHLLDVSLAAVVARVKAGNAAAVQG